MRRLLLAVFLPALASAQSALPVPVLVQEALPDDPHQQEFRLLPGVERIDEPVTFSLPLPEDSRISDVRRLGLSGASLGQFRALERWGNGNV